MTADYLTNAKIPVKFNIGLQDSRTQASVQGKNFKVDDKITKLPDDPEAIVELMTTRLTAYLTEYATEYYQQTVPCKLTKTANIEVGGTMAIEWDSFLRRELGKRTDDTQYVSVHSANYKFGGDDAGIELGVLTSSGIELGVLTSSLKKLGISPAMTCASVSRSGSELTLTDCTGIAIPTPAGYTSGLGVVGWFGCWSFNEGTGEVEERTCACGDYSVVIFERGVQQLTKAGASRNCWEGTLAQPTSVQVSGDDCVITLDDTTNFDTVNAANGDFVIKFGRLDDSATQPCQANLYGWLGSSNGRVNDADSVPQPAIQLGP
jgi:hypothetical protein